MPLARNLMRNAVRDQIPSLQHIDAHSVDEALEMLRKHEGAIAYAGGTELLTGMKDRLWTPSVLVNIKPAQEMQGIQEEKGDIVIGALTRLADIADSSLLNEQAPALAQAARAAASPQIRRLGTLGGNLCQDSRCWYYRSGFNCYRRGGFQCYAQDGDSRYHAIMGGERCITVHPSDTAPALLALDAKLEIARPGSGRRTVAAANFFVGPQTDITRMNILGKDELLTRVIIPRASLGSKQNFTKVQIRQSWDFALVAVATVLPGNDRQQARIALNGVAPTPIRAHAAEQVLRTAGTATEEVAWRAGEAFVAQANPLGDNRYKVRLTKRAIQKSILAVTEA